MKRMLFALMIFGVALAPRAHAVHYSKLGIVTAAKAAGKWEVVKAWIAENGYTDEWQAAAYFADDYPMFAQITNQVVASGIATRAEVDAFLAAARDTAPDALLSHVYAADAVTVNGRAKWHGGSPTISLSTNETTRIIEAVETYPDGFVFIDPARRRKYLTPEEEAERYLARQARRQGSLEDRIAALRALIASLEAQRDNGTNELEAAHAIIQLAAKRRTLMRLEASRTNVVSVVVQPEGK